MQHSPSGRHRHRTALLLLLAGSAAGCSSGSCRFSLTRRIVNTSSADAHSSSSRHPLTAAAAAGGAAEHGIPGREASRRLQEEVAISGDFRQLAYFYIDVFVGTPAQKASVITDTGSTLLAFPGTACGDCGSHMNPRFDPSRSTTISPVGCGSQRCSGPSIACSQDRICSYSQSYAEGSSLSGVFYTDRVFIGDDDPASLSSHASYTLPDFKFGVHRHEDGLFTTQLADGIMGLGTGGLSIVPALWGAGLLSEYVFSMCLSLNGGAFTLGAVDSSLHISPPAWAAMSAAGFYSVSVTGMALVSLSPADAAADGTPASSAQTVVALDVSSFRGGETIVDSGTTFTYIPSNVFNALKAQIQIYCGGGAGRCSAQSSVTMPGESLCYRLRSFSDVHTFPGVTISLAPATPGAPPITILIPPSRLFLSMVWDRGAYCLSVYANNRGGAVLGGTSMMGYDVIFDLEGPAGPRIGWAPSACEVHEGAIVGSADATPSASTAATPSGSSAPTPPPTSPPSLSPFPSVVPQSVSASVSAVATAAFTASSTSLPSDVESMPASTAAPASPVSSATAAAATPSTDASPTASPSIAAALPNSSPSGGPSALPVSSSPTNSSTGGTVEGDGVLPPLPPGPSAYDDFNLDGIGGFVLGAGILAVLITCATCCWCAANRRCGFCCARSDTSGGGGRWADVSLFGMHIRIESSAAAKADAAVAAVDASFSETEPMHRRPGSAHSPSSSGGGSSSSKSRGGGGRYLSTRGRAAVSSVLNAAASAAAGLGSVKRGGGSGVGKYAVVDEEGDGGGVGGVFGTGAASVMSSSLPGSAASSAVSTSSSLAESSASGAPGFSGARAAAAAAARSDGEGFGVKLEDVQVV